MARLDKRLKTVEKALEFQWGNPGYKRFWNKVLTSDDTIQTIIDYLNDDMAADVVAEMLINNQEAIEYEIDKMTEDFSMGVGAPLGVDQGIPHGGDCKGVMPCRMDLAGKPCGCGPCHDKPNPIFGQMLQPQYWTGPGMYLNGYNTGLKKKKKKKKKKSKKNIKSEAYLYLTKNHLLNEEFINEGDIVNYCSDMLKTLRNNIENAIFKKDIDKSEEVEEDCEQLEKEVKAASFTTGKKAILTGLGILLTAASMATAGDFSHAMRYVQHYDHNAPNHTINDDKPNPYNSHGWHPSTTVNVDRHDVVYGHDDGHMHNYDNQNYSHTHSKHHKHDRRYNDRKTTTVHIGLNGIKVDRH